jgi:hypothetical protein
MPTEPAQISPITIFTPVRRWWTWWLWATWLIADRSLFIKRKVRDLNFIHVAHWALLKRRPALSTERPRARLHPPYVLFQSNYDGDAVDYVETFAYRVPWHIRGMWGRAYGFRGPRVPSEFVAYVINHAAVAPEHYYCAYSTGTVRTVHAALQLEKSFCAFRREVRDLDEEKFAAAWQRFLTREQRNL